MLTRSLRLLLVATAISLGSDGALAKGGPTACPFDATSLFDSAPSAAASFGSSVAADADVLVVGTPLDGGFALGYPGSISIWRWSGTEYLFEQEVDGPLPADVPLFGSSVAVDGTVAVVGAPGNSSSSPGLVYIYRFQDGVWSEEQILNSSAVGLSPGFGQAVAIDGDVIAVGASGDDEAATNAGAVYLFRWDGFTWNEETKLLASDATSDDTLGSSVALSGNTLIAGAAGAIFVGGFNAGAVYCFRYEAGSWIETQKLTASPAVSYDQFGTAVAVDGGTLAITAGYGGAGQAYLYSHNGGGWVLQQQLEPGSDESSDGGLGWHTSVALDGDTVAFGDEEGPLAGGFPHNVYVYRFDGIEWAPTATLSTSGGANDELYGASLALAEDRLSIGIPGRDTVAADAGGVEVVELCRSGFVRGDINQDALINIADAVFGLDFLFEPGAAAAPCPDAADVNDDGTLDLADPIALLILLFQPTVNTLPFPYPACGADPTVDTIAAGLCDEACP